MDTGYCNTERVAGKSVLISESPGKSSQLCFVFILVSVKTRFPLLTFETSTWHTGGSVPVDISLDEEREEIT